MLLFFCRLKKNQDLKTAAIPNDCWRQTKTANAPRRRVFKVLVLILRITRRLVCRGFSAGKSGRDNLVSTSPH